MNTKITEFFTFFLSLQLKKKYGFYYLKVKSGYFLRTSQMSIVKLSFIRKGKKMYLNDFLFN